MFFEIFEKVHGTFLFEKSKNFVEKGGGGVFRENFEKFHGTFSYFIRGGSEDFSKKEGVGGEFEKFRKVSICSIKKVPAPPPRAPTRYLVPRYNNLLSVDFFRLYVFGAPLKWHPFSVGSALV